SVKFRERGEVWMKLFFPDGEHPQVLIGEGAQQVGSGADVDIALALPEVVARHAELIRAGDVLTLRALEGAVSGNGQALAAGGEAILRPGDRIGCAAVTARVVAVEKAGMAPPAARTVPVDDSGATRVRMAVPRFVLRGV